MKQKNLLGQLTFLAISVLILLFLTNGCKNKVANEAKLTLADISDYKKTKDRILQKDTVALKQYHKLLDKADKELDKKPYSVVNKIGMPPSNDKHDYLSLAPYFWPNPETPDGKPYIRKDGQVNPETRDNFTDFEEMSAFFSGIKALSEAYYYSAEKKYAEKAVVFLNAWFIDDETRMNPHLNYGQGIPGVNDGRPFGIIEFSGIAGVINAVELLKISGHVFTESEDAFKNWLEEYAVWLQKSDLGNLERTRSNNHGTKYDVQLCSILLYLGETDEAKRVLEEAKTVRIASQIEPDGSQPHELARTKSFSYTVTNLKALTQLAYLGKKVGIDLWNFKTADGRSIKGAYNYLIAYLDNDKVWAYEQISSVNIRENIVNIVSSASKTFDDKEFKTVIENYNKETK